MTTAEMKELRQEAKKLFDLVELQDDAPPLEVVRALMMIRDNEVEEYRQDKDVSAFLFMLSFSSYQLGLIVGKRAERARRKNGKKQ